VTARDFESFLASQVRCAWDWWKEHHQRRLVAVFFFDMVSQTFDDSKPINLFAVGTYSDGSVALIPPSGYQLALDSGLEPVQFTTTEPTTIPGTSIVAPVGTVVNQVPATNTPEEVTATPTGFANGVTVSPFQLDDAPPPPPVLESVSFVPLQ
jgi:hypothetical protein